MEKKRDGRFRSCIRIGLTVDIVLKSDQKNGKVTHGVVAEILTNASFHPHGIKVRLKDRKVGRVSNILEDERGSS